MEKVGRGGRDEVRTSDQPEMRVRAPATGKNGPGGSGLVLSRHTEDASGEEDEDAELRAVERVGYTLLVYNCLILTARLLASLQWVSRVI